MLWQETRHPNVLVWNLLRALGLLYWIFGPGISYYGTGKTQRLNYSVSQDSFSGTESSLVHKLNIVDGSYFSPKDLHSLFRFCICLFVALK